MAMSDLVGGRLEDTPGSQMKVIKNEFGGTDVFVKCEIYGRWFWLKVENQELYMNLHGNEHRDMDAIHGAGQKSVLRKAERPQVAVPEDRFEGFEHTE
jgi:hypothetical protein